MLFLYIVVQHRMKNKFCSFFSFVLFNLQLTSTASPILSSLSLSISTFGSIYISININCFNYTMLLYQLIKAYLHLFTVEYVGKNYEDYSGYVHIFLFNFYDLLLTNHCLPSSQHNMLFHMQPKRLSSSCLYGI